jgi:hypothetical protein
MQTNGPLDDVDFRAVRGVVVQHHKWGSGSMWDRSGGWNVRNVSIFVKVGFGATDGAIKRSIGRFVPSMRYRGRAAVWRMLGRIGGGDGVGDFRGD